jgi:gamma-glutamyltranspeptidase/glutathione hydrolase
MHYYGDPDFTRSPVNGLASPAFAAERARAIRFDRAAPRPIAPADPWPYETAWEAPEVLPMAPSVAGIAGTSQMAAVDQQGNLATLCTSLTASFGSVVLVPGTGVFLNNCMQNFDPRPEAANCITPGKMPIFAVPTIVAARDGKALFGAGGSGGYRILSAVLHTMLHAIDFDMSIQAAVDAPRVFCQADATYVDERIPAAIRDRLAGLGHKIVVERGGALNTYFGRVNGIWIDPTTSLRHAGTGPALTTGAAGY